MYVPPLPLTVKLVDPRTPCGRSEESEDDTNQRRFAGTIGTQQTENFARRDIQCALVKRGKVSVGFAQRFGTNNRR